ncbi:L-glyceraldehyde 3-phosphate reductase [Paenibacillus sp. WQ 127069]|uniref:L-glyceraldehyde 3-phosphate reductase n=1 Tax=Paenibacillus baimaensis TaxID=2982185 RepID=A0ABT2UU68_9BACL|nr:L-glyceraldehyde 3-phosphate reductase [Paenibacillus sp. WQ 127069]MCU6798197.1 L-glyceraldehyde 3-phosphate reductase [Paenibacillus sp. WQ 127069]
MTTYLANEDRYDSMVYNRCGRSGLKLPAVSLGLWHNFGDVDTMANARSMICRSFDLGITHFDLANNYGPSAGSAEETFGRLLKSELSAYRDQLIVSTKAGYYMWPGPYGEWGSRKNLVSSLDQSLKRMGLDYVDIFYSHRPDPHTPMEETMGALDQIVRQGKALYVGISNYNAEQTKQAIQILKSLGTPLLIHQATYSMFNRWVENGLLDELEEGGAGCIAFSPLAQGMLTNRYLTGIPGDSRAASSNSPFLKEHDITEEKLTTINQLNEFAAGRGQSLAQLALAWVLRQKQIASVLIGASKVSQIEDNVGVLNRLSLSSEEVEQIEAILK